MAETSLPVEFLFTLNALTSAPTVIQNGPQGDRYVVAVTGGTVDGPKVKGKVAENPGGDWLTLRADGSFKLDVRLIIKTDDGADILMTYTGIGVRTATGVAIRSAPLFETGDERYAWLNNVQAVGIGAPGRGDVTYQVYALSV
jgi:hypothetical protein